MFPDCSDLISVLCNNSDKLSSELHRKYHFCGKTFLLGYVECSDQTWHVCQIVTSDILLIPNFVCFFFFTAYSTTLD